MTSVETELDYIRNNTKNRKMLNDELDKFIFEHPVSKFMATPYLEDLGFGGISNSKMSSFLML